MKTKEKIENELKNALKEKDDFKREALRFLLSAIQNKEIEKRGKGKEEQLTEEEIVELLRKELKKRKEAEAIYREGGRIDLAEKEKKEAEIIEKFLPAEMGDKELENIVEEIIRKTGAVSLKESGIVIKEVIKIVGPTVSPSRVAEMARRKLTELVNK